MKIATKLKKAIVFICSVCILGSSFTHAVFAANRVNVALNCSAKISGAYSINNVGAKAVDGDINTIWASGSVGGDKGIEDKTIVVDLDDMYNIDEVNVRTRRDMDANWDRSGWFVYISKTSDFSDAVLIGRKPTQGKFKEDLEIKLDQPVTGRYVKVTAPGSNVVSITISEIEVYGDIVKDENSIPYFEDVNMTDAVTLVSFLKILQGQNSTEFAPGRLIKRAEAANIALKLIRVQPSGGVNPYSDLPEDHPYRNSVITANSMGIVSTAERFNPDEYASVIEFTSMILRALGVYYDTSGGYPTSVIRCAEENKLLKNIEQGINEKINKETAVNILYNALKVYPFEIKSLYNNNGSLGMSYKRSEITALEKYHNIKIIEGVVTQNNATTLSSLHSMSAEHICIGTETYTDKSKSLYKYIGKSVKVLVDITTNTDIYTGWESDRNQIIKVSSDAVIDLSKTDIKYEDVTGNIKNIKTSTPYVLRNGVSYTGHSYTKATVCLPGAELVLVDNDSDNIFDVIDIRQPIYMCPETVVYDDLAGTIRITDKNGQGVTLEEWDNLTVNIGGSESKIKQLSGMKFIAVYRDAGDKNIEIKGFLDYNAGTVESKGNDEIIIDGKTYGISQYFTSNIALMGSCTVGDSVNYFVDDYGKLVWIGQSYGNSDSKEHYGVITKCIFKHEEASFKIFSDAGTFDTYTVDKKCTIDGDKLNSEDVVSKGKDYYFGKIVVFKANSEKILKYIDTETVNDNSEHDKLKQVSSSGSDIKMIYGNVYDGFTQLVSTRKDMIVFNIPYIEGKICNLDILDSYYSVSTRKEAYGNSVALNNDDKFYAVKSDGFAGVSVRAVKVPFTEKNYMPSRDENAPLIILEKATKSVNNDNEVFYKLKGYNISEGSYLEATVPVGVDYAVEISGVDAANLDIVKLVKYNVDLSTDAGSLVSFDNLNNGDILRCDITKDKIITGIDRLFNSQLTVSQKYLYGQNNGGPTAGGWVSSFKAINFEGGYLYLNLGTGNYRFDYNDFARMYVVEDKNIESKATYQIPAYIRAGDSGMIYIKSGKPYAIVKYIK